MSQNLIRSLQDDEMNCYVCRKQIIELAKLRGVYKDKTKEYALTTRELKVLRADVNEVVPVELRLGYKKMFRHVGCNPVEFKPSVEEL